MPIRSARSNSAFTLVELLVVIGIIAVLVSLLVSVAGGIRKQARIVSCSARLRGIGQACLSNAAEREGHLPLAGRVTLSNLGAVHYLPASLGDHRVRRYQYANIPGQNVLNVVPFVAALAPHLGVKNLPRTDWTALDQALNSKEGAWQHFICPDTNAYEKATVGMAPGDSTVEGQATMMVIGTDSQTFSAWATNSDYAANEGVFGYHFDTAYARNRLAGNLAKITRARDTVLFADGIPRKAPADPLMPHGWMTWTPSLNGVGPATLADALTDSPRADASDNFDLNRHGKRINVLFADGHVETFPITPEALDQVYLVAP